MDYRAQQLLQSFSQGVNNNHMLPDDWRRFFDLTVYVHRHHVLMTGQQVRLHLVACGFSVEASSRLGATFELFSQLLTIYDHQSKAPDRRLYDHEKTS
jgi:hypothetical protein